MANQNAKNPKSNTNKKKDSTKVSKNTSQKKDMNFKEEKKVIEVKKQTSKIEKDSVKNATMNNSKPKRSEFKLTSKQRDIVLVLLVIVLLIVAMIITINKNPKLDIDLPVSLEGDAGFTEISYSEYEEKLQQEKAFLVVIVKDGCDYCSAYEPVLEEVAKEYSIPINYINLTNLNNDEQSELVQSNTYLKNKKWGTPTTLLLYGDIVVDSISGYVEKDTLVSFIEENIKVDNSNVQ